MTKTVESSSVLCCKFLEQKSFLLSNSTLIVKLCKKIKIFAHFWLAFVFKKQISNKNCWWSKMKRGKGKSSDSEEIKVNLWEERRSEKKSLPFLDTISYFCLLLLHAIFIGKLQLTSNPKVQFNHHLYCITVTRLWQGITFHYLIHLVTWIQLIHNWIVSRWFFLSIFFFFSFNIISG